MKNETRKKLNGIEKICLIGIIGGLSFLSIETGLDYYQNKNNITKYKLVILGLLDIIGLACVGYSQSLKKDRENYYYKN